MTLIALKEAAQELVRLIEDREHIVPRKSQRYHPDGTQHRKAPADIGRDMKLF